MNTEPLYKVVFDEKKKQATCFGSNWLPTKFFSSFTESTPAAIQNNNRAIEDTATSAKLRGLTASDALTLILRAELRRWAGRHLKVQNKRTLIDTIYPRAADFTNVRKSSSTASTSAAGPVSLIK